MPIFTTMDEYQAAQQEPGRAVLAELRQRVAALAPEVEETIAYDMPTFAEAGRALFHAAVWKAHLAVYPVPSAPAADPGLVDDLAAYLTGRSTLRFGYREGLPWPLIERVVRAHLANDVS